MDARRYDDPPAGWPQCESEQVQVMLLGTYHMDNPSLDEVNIDADDVLAADRRAQFRELVDRFETWNPDRIAVERPYDEFEAVSEIYEEYRSGEYAYNRKETFPPPHPERNDLGTPTGVEQTQREADERLASSTLLEYFESINTEAGLRDNHDLMFDAGIRADDSESGSPIALSHWYDRNIRMIHHCWRVMEAGDERLFYWSVPDTCEYCDTYWTKCRCSVR